MSFKRNFLPGKSISAKKIINDDILTRRINTACSPLNLKTSYKAEDNIFLKERTQKSSREKSSHRSTQNQTESEYSEYFHSPLSTGLKDKEKKFLDERYCLQKKRLSANYETFIVPKEEIKILNKVKIKIFKHILNRILDLTFF